MGIVYGELVDHAEAMVNIVNRKYLNGNSMAYLALLSGVGSCRVESFEGAGHNYQAVIDAVHNCYARNKESKYNDGYSEGIFAMINIANNLDTLQNLVNIIFYQLKKEKDGTAQFTINTISIINKLNTKINENCSNYEKDNKSFNEWIERNRKYAFENYSIELG